MKRYIIERLLEPSTWRGITLLLTAVGVSISPEMQEAIVTTGLGVAGLIGVATSDQ